MNKPVPKYNAIMIIDDNEIDNFINQKMIEGCNFADRIYIHTSSKSALEFLQNMQREKVLPKEMIPEIIFLDINMPILDGYQFLEEYNKLDPAINKAKIVLLSSSLNPVDLEKSNKIPQVIRYLNKPLLRKHLDEI